MPICDAVTELLGIRIQFFWRQWTSCRTAGWRQPLRWPALSESSAVVTATKPGSRANWTQLETLGSVSVSSLGAWPKRPRVLDLVLERKPRGDHALFRRHTAARRPDQARQGAADLPDPDGRRRRRMLPRTAPTSSWRKAPKVAATASAAAPFHWFRRWLTPRKVYRWSQRAAWQTGAGLLQR